MGPLVGVQFLVEHPGHRRDGMVHQVLPDEAGAVCEAVREQRRTRIQQEPRSADPVAGDHHHPRSLFLNVAVFVVVDGSCGEPVLSHGDLPHPGPRPHYRAIVNGLRPVNHVGAGLGPRAAPDVAGSAVVARPAAVVALGVDVTIRGPPMPSHLVEGLGSLDTQLPQRYRRHLSRRLGRIRRVAVHPSDAVQPVIHREVGLQLGVADRPVVGHAVQTLDSEVRRVQAGEVGTPMDSAPTNRVVHEGRDGRIRVVDRVVLRQPPHVGLGTELVQAVKLPIVLRGGVFLGVQPIALL